MNLKKESYCMGLQTYPWQIFSLNVVIEYLVPLLRIREARVQISDPDSGNSEEGFEIF
jgi:hypothetical protein